MAHERKLKQINKNAILVHQLQSEDKESALSYFSKQSIEKATCNSEGLQIFFREYDLVKKSIRREKIEVGGLFYKIYPLVTNLTISGIGPFATDSAIEDIMQAYGFIIDLYRIQETKECQGFKTVSLTDDYRVILDVPEIFAPSLTPVRLPKVTKRVFEVLFFCRLCRCNGHMQFQCSNAKNSSSSSTSRQTISRNLSYESDSTVKCDQVSRLHFHLPVGERSSKGNYISQIKTEKEQNYFSDQKCSKGISHKNNNSKNCSERTMHFKSKKCHDKISNNVDNRKKRRLDSFSLTSACGSNKFKDNSSSSPKKPSNEILDRKSFQKRSFHQYSDNEGSKERIEASTSKKYSEKKTSINNSSKKKKQTMEFLSKLLPPGTDLYETEKLIQIALKCSPEDITGEIQAVLLSILEYNRELKNKYTDKDTRYFLNWIHSVLNEIEGKKIRNVKFHKNIKQLAKRKQECAKDEKSNAEIPKQRSSVKRAITLSLGIKEAITRTDGELQPTFLYNFLNQVRGRKNLFEVAYVFTNNIPALASQLLKVQKTYYKYVQKRGPEEDRDISFIKRLRLRLLKNIKDATQISTEAAVTEVSIKTEPVITEILVKTELDSSTYENKLKLTEVPVKTEPGTTEAQFVKSEQPGMTEVQFMKSEQPDMTEVHFVKSEQPDITKISMKTDSLITNKLVEGIHDISKVLVKREPDIFMRQSSSDRQNSLYSASYFTNITQMPFTLDAIETEINDMD